MSISLTDYLARLRGKRVAVLGIGISNVPLIALLCEAGIAVTACDRRSRTALGATAETLKNLGVQLVLGEDYLAHLDADVVFRTPGMRPDLPELNAVRARGGVVTSEMEAFFAVCPCHTLGVTGSDGKTTTTTIIAELLRRAGKKVFVGGNIGRPLLADVAQMQPKDWAVLELSSFQLIALEESPEIAVMTNLAPNHLDMHRSMEEYIAAKENIFTHQAAKDFAVFNADNSITHACAAKAKGNVMEFSRRQELTLGVFVKDAAICVASDAGTRRVLALSDILLPGEHNIENYMAAIAAVAGLVPDEVVRDFAKTFGGVPHRIELVRTRGGVRYYNDSIASSPTRTIAGLNSFSEKVILIAGGYDKNLPFDVLGPEIAWHVKHLYLTGDTATKICAAVGNCPTYRGSPDIIICADFTSAVQSACAAAQSGDVVLLSPACASFDQFENFAQRGEAFRTIILNLKE